MTSERENKSKRTEFGIRSFLYIVILVVAVNCSACFSMNGVHYTLPNGYMGIFKIVLDEEGIEAKSVNGDYTYKVPESGILRVRSLRPFNDMHLTTASYQDGTGVVVEDSTVKGEMRAVRNLGAHSIADAPETIIILVGTEKQASYTNSQMYSDSDFWSIAPAVFNERLKQIK